MEGSNSKAPLHTFRHMPHTGFNHVFALIYVSAIFAILYHHLSTLLHSTTFPSATISTTLLISDVILAVMWATTTAFRIRPIIRHPLLENLEKVMAEKDFPAMDIFICTADPFKEPPMNVVNTALSLMAYDYPQEKISVYVSDDGGSELTLFAFMEAAKFARYWLPFCREKGLVDRCPDAFFASNYDKCFEIEEIKLMYESMKIKVENIVERGMINPELVTDEQDRRAFDKYRTKEFTRHDHPAIIQILLESGEVKDIRGHSMPNLVYVSREKNRTTPHHFKAGALNALVRVSAIMTNAPVILTQDCDMYSNDPKTPLRALCYLCDPSLHPDIGYIQFPQRYHGINDDDIYANEFKRLFISNPTGMNGLAGPSYVGSGCFFLRRVFFGGPSSMVSPELPELNPDHVVGQPIKAQRILSLAHNVAGCNYENLTMWGSKLGFRYGSLVEDFYTGFRLQCEGWKSIYCNPTRPAFLGDIPITLNDALSQTKRWAIGLLEVMFSKYCPLVFGIRLMGPLMGLCYAHYAFWPMWSIPITIYSFLPQIALLNGVSIFPKVTDPWFWLYAFLFLGAYGQDYYDFILFQGTVRRWWNDQRMWLIRGLSSFLFGLIEYTVKHMGIATQGFNVTSKIQDDEQSKRYEQAKFEFGIPSPLFLPLTAAALVNLFAFVSGLVHIVFEGNMEGLFAQMFLSGFGVVNSWPIYEAVVLRGDKGKMPTKTTVVSAVFAVAVSGAGSLVLNLL